MSLTDTGVSHEQTASRASRRTRRMVIVGALAIVLVAGLVLVGAKTNGARSGALVAGTMSCSPSGSTTSVTLKWKDDVDRSAGAPNAGTFTVTPTTGDASAQSGIAGKVANDEYSVSFTGTRKFSWAFSVSFTGSALHSSPISYVATFSCPA